MGKYKEKAQYVATETNIALQTVYNALNQGQKKKLLKEPTIKALFDRYAVIYDTEE